MKVVLKELGKAIGYLTIGFLVSRSLYYDTSPCASLAPAKLCFSLAPAKLCFSDKAASLRMLGLGGDATLRDVQKAYTRLARQYHPDRAGQAQLEVSAHVFQSCRMCCSTIALTICVHSSSVHSVLNLCCTRVRLMQRWRLVSGSYECLRVLLRPPKVMSDAIERKLYPDSKEPLSSAQSEHKIGLQWRTSFAENLRNSSHALRLAEVDVASWNTLGYNLREIDRIQVRQLLQ